VNHFLKALAQHHLLWRSMAAHGSPCSFVCRLAQASLPGPGPLSNWDPVEIDVEILATVGRNTCFFGEHSISNAHRVASASFSTRVEI